MLIYTVVLPPTGIFIALLIGCQVIAIVDVLVVHTQILYYTHNSFNQTVLTLKTIKKTDSHPLAALQYHTNALV